MDGQNNKNLILAMVLSMLVITVWMFLFPPPEPAQDPDAPTTAEGQAALPPAVPGEGATVADPAAADPTAAEALPEAERLTIDTPALAGSINMRGGRFDDLRLKQYRETLDPASPEGVALVEQKAVKAEEKAAEERRMANASRSDAEIMAEHAAAEQEKLNAEIEAQAKEAPAEGEVSVEK